MIKKNLYTDKAIYLISIFVFYSAMAVYVALGIKGNGMLRVVVLTPLFGGLASTLYSMRAVYIHSIKLKNHDAKFDLWIYLRPYVGAGRGLIMGFIYALLYVFSNGKIHKPLLIILILACAFVEGYFPILTRFMDKHND